MQWNYLINNKKKYRFRITVKCVTRKILWLKYKKCIYWLIVQELNNNNSFETIIEKQVDNIHIKDTVFFV